MPEYSLNFHRLLQIFQQYYCYNRRDEDGFLVLTAPSIPTSAPRSKETASSK
ncbi:unnamed protein product, partial [Nesidiocoris tenuis]